MGKNAEEQSNESEIGLADLLRAFRTELEAYRKGKPRGQKPLFEIKEAVVEVALGAKAAVEVGGQLKIYFFHLGGKGAAEDTSAMRVTLTLEAIDAGPDEEEPDDNARMVGVE